jgi:hypothetical protein
LVSAMYEKVTYMRTSARLARLSAQLLHMGRCAN